MADVKPEFSEEGRSNAQALSAAVAAVILEENETFKGGLRSIDGSAVPTESGGVRLSAILKGQNGEKLGSLDAVMEVKGGVRLDETSIFDADGKLVKKSNCEKSGEKKTCTNTDSSGELVSKSITLGKVTVEKDATGRLLSTSEVNKEHVSYLSLVVPFMTPNASMEMRKVDAEGRTIESYQAKMTAEKLVPFTYLTKGTLDLTKHNIQDGRSSRVLGVTHGFHDHIDVKAELKGTK